MYLTKFPLNMTRRETRHMLASPYRLHAALAGCFPPSWHSGEVGRILWRVDYSSDGSADLYIVSPRRPSLVGLDEQVGWPDLDPQWMTRDYEPLLERIDLGQVFAFRLVANPVVSRSAMRNEKGSSKRISHLTVLQQSAWLVGSEAYDDYGIEPPELFSRDSASRAERNGFAVVRGGESKRLQLQVSDSRKYEFWQGEKRHRITLATARFDGILEVTDPDLIRHALTCGIGHGKGFGCGLLTLARPGVS